MSNWLSFFSKNITYLILRELNESCDSMLVNNLQREWDFFFLPGWPSWGLFLKWGYGWFRCQGKQYLPPLMVPALSEGTPDDLHMKASLRHFKRPRAPNVHSLDDGHRSVLEQAKKKKCSLNVFNLSHDS